MSQQFHFAELEAKVQKQQERPGVYLSTSPIHALCTICALSPPGMTPA